MKYPLQVITDTCTPEYSERINMYILCNYGTIAKEIVLTPFVAPSQRMNTIYSNIQGPYSVIHDWEGRKEILREIILIFKKVHKKSFYQKNIERAFRRINRYEFLIKELQVDEHGPCHDHFLNVFRHLKTFPEASKNTRGNYLLLLEIYRMHLINYQFTDPSVFSKEMLAIVCQKYFNNKKVSKLFECSTQSLLKKANKDLLRNRLKMIFEEKETQRQTFKLANHKGLWHNLLNIDLISKEENLPIDFTSKEDHLQDDIFSKENGLAKDFNHKKGNLGSLLLTPKEKWFVKANLRISPLDLAVDLFSLKYQLSKFYTQVVLAKGYLPLFISVFSSLKYHYSCFLNFLAENPDGQHSSEISQMHSILLQVYLNCQHFFTKTRKEFMLAVRLEKNFELAYLFLYYAIIKIDLSFENLKESLDLILDYNDPVNRFKGLKYDISMCYGLIAKEILHNPLQSKDQTHKADSKDLNTIGEWEDRKEILAEIIYSLKDLSEMAKEIEGENKFLWGKIAKYEFIIKEFQVDSLEHFKYIFRQLQSQVNREDSYENISPITRKLLALFKVYYQNLYRWQFTNPFLIPKSMLAIISHQNLKKRKIFELLKLPIDKRLQEAIKLLELTCIKTIISRVKNLETNFIPAKSHDLSFKRELWHNLMNLDDVLTPVGKWIVNIYLVLSR
jgi:hypothetical protein